MNVVSIEAATTALQSGAVGVFPTDTVYGLIASAHDIAAVERLYELKHRHFKPGTIIAASIDQLVGLGIPRRYLTAVADYWPNPLSVVVPVGENLSYLHLGKHSLAVRIPDNKMILNMLEAIGPLATSSANLPGEPTAESVSAAYDYFGETVDFYVDGGILTDHQPSTVIQVLDDAIEVLRQGAIDIETIRSNV